MIHIHTHSLYSLRDSIIKPDDLISRLKEIEHNAIAITDHGTSLGGISFYKKLKENGIKYIHGCEMYVCDDLSIKDKDNRYYHLIVLCLNDIGRINLNKLISKSGHPDNFYYKPRIDFNLLEQYKDGLLISSACMAGEISRYLLSDNYEKAKEIALKYKSVFGDNYYLEVQSHNDPIQIKLNKQIYDLSLDTSIECVVTCDAHYVRENDRDYQNKYAFNGSYKEDGETYIDCFIQTEQDVRSRLTYFADDVVDRLINNTHIIAEKCNVDMPLSAPIMPHINTPKIFTSNREWLESICEKGFRSKLNINLTEKCLYDDKIKLRREIYDDEGNWIETYEFQLSQNEINEYINRYEYELNSLERMGFIDYILLVYSYANVAKRRGIARGSGGGSLVCYLSNITNIDPIEHGLYFERFIDVSALDLLESGEITVNELKIPDIDLDFSGESCKEVLHHLYDTYGEDNVASIGKFGTNQTKGTIRDLCKVFDIDLKTADLIAKAFDNYEIDEIDNLINSGEKIPESARDAVSYIEKYPVLFDYVRKLNGLPKSFGLHACFTGNTIVLTSGGYKKISDIKIGDYVFTHKSNYKPVVNIYENNTSELIEINACGIFPIKCTINHPFYVRHRIKGRVKKYSEPEWVDAQNLKKTDMLCLPVNKNDDIPKFKSIDFTNKNLWWLIGRYIGDGWCEYVEDRKEKRLIICCNKKTDGELNEILSKIDNILDFRFEESRTTYKIFIKNDELFEYLQRFGKYAYGKKLNSDIFNLPEYLLVEFLNGYISADGYIGADGFCYIKTVSYDLANGLIQCIAKTFKKHCGVHTLPEKLGVIENRNIQNKEKYVIYFQQNKVNKQRNYYDGNYIWLYIKSVKKEIKQTKVYNLSVLDDNTYTVNNIAVHNCGKVISTKPLDEFLPSCYDSDGVRYLQGDMHDVEDVGLVKIDVLGLRTLDQEYDTLEMSGESLEYIDPKNQDYTDPKVLDIFRKGNTVGIFQFSSYGMRETLKKMDVRGIEDLSIANALYRPGSMAYIDDFCKRRKGHQDFEYLHEDLIPILKNTYGIIVFQEQLIEIGRYAGIRNPDLLRKATGKKDIKLLNKVKPELEEKLKSKGWSNDQFDKLWSDMIEFSKYSFNKAHSSAYAIIGYITAKQKAYYPVEFFAGLCNSYIGKSSFVKDDADEILSDAFKNKIRLYPFNYRNDHRVCSVKDNKLVYAIPLIKECNQTVAEILFKLGQKENEYFWKVIDELIKNGVNKSQLRIIIKLDFFKEFSNSKKLLRILDIFEFFKCGEAKTINKEKLTDNEFLYRIVSENSNDIGANGKELKSFRIENIENILNQCEQYINSFEIDDFDYKNKIATQKEYLGFVSLITEQEEDRPKLFIKKIFEAKRKSDGKQFGYNVIAQSIGSGKETNYTILNRHYTEHINEESIIYCDKYTQNGKYYNIEKYHILTP